MCESTRHSDTFLEQRTQFALGDKNVSTINNSVVRTEIYTRYCSPLVEVTGPFRLRDLFFCFLFLFSGGGDFFFVQIIFIHFGLYVSKHGA